MKHREKLRLARKLLSPAEVRKHTSPFNGKCWTSRVTATLEKIAKQVAGTKSLKQLLVCGTCHRKMKKIEGSKYHGVYACPAHPDIHLSVG
jgi:hypothetical protein